jgi:two-component system, chemotaxis family, chemotaxis protein CheY
MQRMKKILVVDDSATMRHMVQASLSRLAESAFIEAGNGLEAIEQLALTAVDLIVADLNMPDMHGIELIRFVRKQPAYQAVPIVVLTTRSDAASRSAALAAGASYYLTKPFSPDELAAEVGRLLTHA